MIYTLEKSAKGFTLIELAIVLIIISVLLGGFFNSLSNRMDTANRNTVKKDLQEIKQALLAFSFSRSPPYLPCPDTDSPPDGFENRNPSGACASKLGYLPWNTLGVGFSDVWNNRYKYWVHFDFSDSAGFNLQTTDEGYALASDKYSTVVTRIGNIAKVLLDNAVAVVISHGSNGLGAISSGNVNRGTIPPLGGTHDDEFKNNDLDHYFYSRPPTPEGADQAGGVFDDILIWINLYEIKAKMVEAGVLP